MSVGDEFLTRAGWTFRVEYADDTGVRVRASDTGDTLFFLSSEVETLINSGAWKKKP